MSQGLYGNMGLGMSSMYANSMPPQNYFRGLEQPSAVEQRKGKGKMKEEDFEAAFAQVVASMDNAPLQSARVDEVDEVGEKLAESSLDEEASDFKQYACHFVLMLS